MEPLPFFVLLGLITLLGVCCVFDGKRKTREYGFIILVLTFIFGWGVAGLVCRIDFKSEAVHDFQRATTDHQVVVEWHDLRLAPEDDLTMIALRKVDVLYVVSYHDYYGNSTRYLSVTGK